MDWSYYENETRILTTNNFDVDSPQGKRSLGRLKESWRRTVEKTLGNGGPTWEASQDDSEGLTKVEMF